MSLSDVIRRLLTQQPAGKPLDLQSLEEARRRLHATVKTSTNEIRKEVDNFATMMRDMHAQRPSRVPAKKTAKKREGAKR